jgi:hypothetical protein
MSGGKFISEAIGNKHLTKGLSVGLEEVGRLGGRITGDVMRKKTWREVDDWEEKDMSLEPLLSPRLSESKLKDLAWSLDVNEQIDKQKFRDLNPKESPFAPEKEDVEFKRSLDSKITYGG